MISKQEMMYLSDGMKIAVTIILKNKQTIEFVREDENNYSGLLTNQTALDKIFEKATDGQGILEGLKTIDKHFVYWDLSNEEAEQLNEKFNSIKSIGDVLKIVIQESTVYDPSDGVYYKKYEHTFSFLSYTDADYKIENGVLKKAPKKGDLVIPCGIKTIPCDFFNAFDIFPPDHAKKAQLRSVVIPEGVTRIGEDAFREQDKLISVQFPSTLEEIDDGAFLNCTSLKTITGLPSNTIIHRLAFAGCLSLATQLPQNNCSMIIVNHILFYPVELNGCFDVVIPDTVRVIDDLAFYGNSDIKTVIFPKNKPKIGNSKEWNANVFCGCNGLADKNGFVIVNNCLYDYCGAQEDITIPSGVTSISGSVHWGKAITVRVPASVNYYGNKCFERVENVIFEGEPPFEQADLGLTGIIKGCLFYEELSGDSDSIIGKGATVIAPEAVRLFLYKNKNIVIAKGVKTIIAPLISHYSETIRDYYIPESVEKITGPIAQNETNRKIVIHAYQGSYGESYATEYGYEFKAITNRSKISWE